MSDFFRMIHKIFFLIIIGSLLASPCAAQDESQPATETVNVIGTSPIYKGDTEKAKENAISNSLLSAVEQAAIKMLPAESLADNFEKLNAVLYGHANDFIQAYKVLADGSVGDIYRVMVEAVISVDRLKEKLSGAGGVKKNLPEILFLIAEQNFQDILPRYWWGDNMTTVELLSEDAMAAIMKEKGFPIVDHSAGIPPKQGIGFGVTYKPYLDSYEAVDIGVRLRADVVIVGKAVVVQSLNSMGENVKAFSGTVAVRAFRTDTGEEIASSVQTAVKANADEAQGVKDALMSAVNLAAEELSTQIEYTWQEKVKRSDLVILTVSGTGNLGNFVMFRKTLTEISGVKEIQIQEMKSDEATIGVDFDGNAESLASKLMVKTFETFGMHVNTDDAALNRLKIELLSR